LLEKIILEIDAVESTNIGGPRVDSSRVLILSTKGSVFHT